MAQAFEEPFGCPKELELLSSPEASDELDESWLASMVAELLEPEGDLPSSISGPPSGALPDLDFVPEYEIMSGYETFHLQQPCQSNKRKRCFLAAD